MLRKLLNPENPLMLTMANLTDCIFLSLFFLLGCLPAVTVGASVAALYDASYRAFRRQDKHSWQRFGNVFRENWKAGLLPTVLMLAALTLIARGLIALWNAAARGQLSIMVFSGGALLGVLMLGVLSVLFPTLSRFENSTAVLLKNTVLLAFANLPRTLALGMLNAICILLCLRYIYPLFFLPSLTALLGSLLIEPMFRPYLPPAEEE